MQQQVLYTSNVNATLSTIIEGGNYNAVMVLADSNTRPLALPQLPCLENATVIEMPSGEGSKTLDTLTGVWRAMQQCGATRHSLLVNLGGGVVTDLGGLAAATFKRGIPFINVPTTLLGAVDAAVGGKTGINFMGLKNEIGAFAPACHVIVSTTFFPTLPEQELKAGFAEMLKHAMLSSSESFFHLLDTDFSCINYDTLLDQLRDSIKIKEDIVRQDPHEQGPRKALNLGHTVGHAFEAKALADGHPIPHGYAVAWGLVTEAVLSHLILNFPSHQLYALASFVKSNYGAFHITCDDYPHLLNIMRHDKKSLAGEINCTLLHSCGDYSINNTISNDDITAALDIYRDLVD